MTGDLLKKFTVTYPNSAPPVQTQISAAQNLSTLKAPEYSPALSLSAPNLKPLGIIPQSPTGYLVSENPFQAAGNSIKEYGKYTKYFYKAAIKGEGTDYTVGKINDLTIRLGSLGIAIILATKKIFPFKKGMEFVGLATWFGSMALWPKVLGAPIKALYGVDINQKYVDSYGRRKSFYEDPQYLPWDLYRHIDRKGKFNKNASEYEYLSEIGDKLGIPRDIENRNEAIQSKMKQIAIQGNTLWMLTAGVMTPVASSLVADALSKPLIANPIRKKQIKDGEKMIDDLKIALEPIVKEGSLSFDKVEKGLKMEYGKEYNNIIQSLKETMSVSEYEKLKELAKTRYAGSPMAVEIMDELINNGSINTDNALRNELIKVSEKAVEDFKNSYLKENEPLLQQYSDLKQSVLNLYKEQKCGTITDDTKISSITEFFEQPKNRPLIRKFETKNIQNLKAFDNWTWGDFTNAIEKRDLTLFDRSLEKLQECVGLNQENVDQAIKSARLEGFGKDALRLQLNQKVYYILGEKTHESKSQSKSLKTKAAEFVMKRLKPVLEKYETCKVNVQKVTNLFKIAEIQMHVTNKINKYKNVTIGDIEGSLTAHNWETVPPKYLKALGFTKKEIKQLATQDMRSVSETIEKRISALIEKPEQMHRAVRVMSELAQDACAQEEKAMLKLIGTSENPGVLSDLHTILKKLSENEKFSKLDEGIKRELNNLCKEVDAKYKNTVNSFGRPIKVIDAFTRVEDYVNKMLGYNADEFMEGVAKGNLAPFKGLSYEESQKIMRKFFKHAIINNGDINNWATKFEIVPPGLSEGFRESKHINNVLIEYFYDPLSKSISQSMPAEFVEKFNSSSREMGARFSAIKTELADNCIKKFYGDVTEVLFNKDGKLSVKQRCDKIDELIKLSEGMRFDNPDEFVHIKTNFTNAKNVITGESQNYQLITDADAFFRDKAHFFTDNKRIAQQQGANIPNFFKEAAINVRPRNKWTKLVWGLFAGTIALSAIVIATMGKTNQFNRDIYKRKTEKGGINENK